MLDERGADDAVGRDRARRGRPPAMAAPASTSCCSGVIFSRSASRPSSGVERCLDRTAPRCDCGMCASPPGRRAARREHRRQQRQVAAAAPRCSGGSGRGWGLAAPRRRLARCVSSPSRSEHRPRGCGSRSSGRPSIAPRRCRVARSPASTSRRLPGRKGSGLASTVGVIVGQPVLPARSEPVEPVVLHGDQQVEVGRGVGVTPVSQPREPTVAPRRRS